MNFSTPGSPVLHYLSEFAQSRPLSQWCHPTHLILCYPLLLLPSIFPSIRVFSSESALRIRRPKYWSFSFTSVLPMNIQDWFSLGWTGWISFQSKGLSRVFSNITVQKHQFFSAQPSLWSSSHFHTCLIQFLNFAHLESLKTPILHPVPQINYKIMSEGVGTGNHFFKLSRWS